MAGTWLNENKILPGAYINFRTNAPLTITPGERGTVALLYRMSNGNAGEIYRITTGEENYPVGTEDEVKLLVKEALKGAKTVLLYNLGMAEDNGLGDALTVLKTEVFNVLCYPYDGEDHSGNKEAIVSFVEHMRTEEGVKLQAVLANMAADQEGIINVVQGIKLSDETTLTAAQVTAWVAGQTAGAPVNKSNTGQKYTGAIDVVPRFGKTQLEEAVTKGQFVFKADTAQNVTAVYDINSLTSFTVEKNKQLSKNRVIRTLDGINNDIIEIFESNYIGKVDNNAEGRSLLRATLIEYFNELQRINAIQNFTAEDVTVSAGMDKDAVVIDCYIQPVDSIEKMYITVSLS